MMEESVKRSINTTRAQFEESFREVNFNRKITIDGGDMSDSEN